MAEGNITRGRPNSQTGPVHNYSCNYAGTWWYTCGCSQPLTHFDTEMITSSVEIIGANYALDLAGMDIMNRQMLWEVIETYFGDGGKGKDRGD